MDPSKLRFASKCRCLTGLTVPKRNFSVTPCYLKGSKRYFIKKNPNFYEASRADRYNRNEVQRLGNRAFRKIPFDDKFPVTAKHTGPQVQGGSKEAARLTALHGMFVTL